MKTNVPVYKGGRLGTISALHHKVIHGDPTAYTDAEYFKEDRQIKKLKDVELTLVCPACFSLRPKMKWRSNRSAESYSITYPVIKRIVSAEAWEKEMTEKYGPV